MVFNGKYNDNIGTRKMKKKIMLCILVLCTWISGIDVN